MPLITPFEHAVFGLEHAVWNGCARVRDGGRSVAIGAETLLASGARAEAAGMAPTPTSKAVQIGVVNGNGSRGTIQAVGDNS